MELRLSEKQGAEFRLVAPDEPAARAAFEAAHPERVRARAEFLASLVPTTDLLSEAEEDEDAQMEDEAFEEADASEVSES
jgi:hypothetical protein